MTRAGTHQELVLTGAVLLGLFGASGADADEGRYQIVGAAGAQAELQVVQGAGGATRLRYQPTRGRPAWGAWQGAAQRRGGDLELVFDAPVGQRGLSGALEGLDGASQSRRYELTARFVGRRVELRYQLVTPQGRRLVARERGVLREAAAQAHIGAATRALGEGQSARAPGAGAARWQRAGAEEASPGGWQPAGAPQAEVPGSGRVPSLPKEVHDRLVELTDPTTLEDMYDLRRRIRELDRIFSERGDPRGLFTSLYRVITNGAVDSVERGLYEDNAWAAKLTHRFGRRYLANLHGDLTGGEVTGAWRAYYKQARNPKVSRARVAGMGAIVHLVADLPKALVETGVARTRRDDFMLFGDVLLEVYPEMVASARDGHGVDMDPLFDLFFVGDAIDAVRGQGTATRWAYQTIRNKTWYAARGLNDLRRPAAQAEIDISWRGFDKILAGLDASGALR